jgi:16S rRNA C967 or C1407 C5-methylase (RsmB/RsmF family)/NOL1/NOP2/fmu family ribosome biogenesis protein
LATNTNPPLPKAFISLLETQLEKAFAESLGKSIAEQAAPVSIRYNAKKISTDALQPIPWEPSATYLTDRPAFVADPLWHAGAYYVQEASSMMIGHLIKQIFKKEESLKVLDLCASPGGKSTQILSTISEDSVLVCNELIGKRATILKENIIKWGYPNVIVCNNEVSHFLAFQQLFDLVLIDAPCSGEGMFRKDPASIDEWSLQRIKECSIRQQHILDDAAFLVKENGYLLYSTCTYNETENIDNVNYLIKKYNFESVSLEIPASWGFQEIQKEAASAWQAFPNQVKGEGFFVAVLRKKKSQLKELQSSHRSKAIDNKVPTAMEKEIFNQYIEHSEDLFYYKKNDDWYGVSKAQANFFKLFLQQMNVIHAGLRIGQFKKEHFIPDAALAVHLLLNKNIPRIELDHTKAIQYLKKENMILPDESHIGWAVVTYQNIALGWVKMIQGGRVNNYFPIEWRIRINLDRLG